MWDAEKLFLNVLVFISAGLYWFSSGHSIPALLGYLIVILYFFDDTFDMLSLLLVIILFFIMIYFFIVDFYIHDMKEDFAKLSFSVLYIGVIYLKSKSIFYKL